MKTIDDLYILWPNYDEVNGEVSQEETEGIVFYGYSSSAKWSVAVVCERIKEIWNPWNGEAKPRSWDGEGLCQGSVELKINNWPDPDQWIQLIETSLRAFSEAGALVAWCGGEESSPSLESLKPYNDSGAVYAAYTDKVGFIYASGLNDDYSELNDNELQSLSMGL